MRLKHNFSVNAIIPKEWYNKIDLQNIYMLYWFQQRAAEKQVKYSQQFKN